MQSSPPRVLRRASHPLKTTSDAAPLAAGQLPQVTLDPRDQIETMTGFMVRAAKGDITHTGAAYYSLYAVAGTLFIITFALTVIGQLIRRRYREEYR